MAKHRAIRAAGVPWCGRTWGCVRRARARHERFTWLKPNGHLLSIRACESHGNYRAIGGGGKYRGAYQFDYSTWAEVGGRGDPAAASPGEQDHRAMVLYLRAGPGRWPVCQHR